jgi:hypothetical protein
MKKIKPCLSCDGKSRLIEDQYSSYPCVVLRVNCDKCSVYLGRKSYVEISIVGNIYLENKKYIEDQLIKIWNFLNKKEVAPK